LASLLLCEVVAAMVGAEAVHFSIIVGLENVLDAGCIFMLISLGVVVVVGVASHGAGSLLA